MNSSVKLTALSFLAATALGAVVFGCTLESGTSDDTDGDTPPSQDKDSGSTTDADTDAGSDAGETPDSGGGTCEAAPENPFACQECLSANCCAALTECLGIVPGDDDPGLDCNSYSDCVGACDADDTACGDACDAAAAAGVVEAYGKILTCANASCSEADCQ